MRTLEDHTDPALFDYGPAKQYFGQAGYERTAPGYYRLFELSENGVPIATKSTRNPLVILWWRIRHRELRYESE